MPTTLTMIGFTFDTPYGGLIFAALMVITVALVSRCISVTRNRRGAARWTVFAIRFVSLSLLASAIAGLEIEYSKRAGARALVVADQNAEMAQHDSIKSILVRSGVQVVDSSNNGPVSGSILVADTGLSSNRASDAVYRAYRDSGGAPVYVVPEQHAEGLLQFVSLRQLTLLGKPIVGIPIGIRCLVHGFKMGERESIITVADSVRVQDSGKLRWSGDNDEQSITLYFTPKSAGFTELTVNLEGVDGQDTSLLTRRFALKVEESTRRVLYFEGEPSWESKFVRRALESSQLFRVDYFAQVSRSAAVAQEQSETPNAQARQIDPIAQLRTILGSASRLAEYDCIIVGPTPNDLLSESEAVRIREWVERRGGGLIVLGENNFNGSVATNNGRLAGVMPAFVEPIATPQAVETAQSSPLEAGKTPANFILTPTDYGRAAALAAYSNDLQAVGAKLPGLSGAGASLKGLKPGAITLAELTSSRGGGAPSPAKIVAMQYGAGRSVLFGPADSWRLKIGDKADDQTERGPFESLWQGMALWASANVTARAEIALGNEIPQTGEKLEITAQFRSATYSPAKAESIIGTLFLLNMDGQPKQETARRLDFSPAIDANEGYSAIFTPVEAGRYLLEVDASVAGERLGATRTFAVSEQSRYEPFAALDTLERVARGTGGAVIQPDDLEKLARQLGSSSSAGSSSSVEKLGFRRVWLLGIFLPLMLSCEWLIQRTRLEEN